MMLHYVVPSRMLEHMEDPDFNSPVPVPVPSSAPSSAAAHTGMLIPPTILSCFPPSPSCYIICLIIYFVLSFFRLGVVTDSEELLNSIAMVQSMGYNERQARAALASTDNNLER